MKTKLGVSVGILAAATYFLGFFSGYTVLTLLVGYILLFEQDSFLRKSAVKAMAISIIFSVVYALVGFIPNLMEILNDLIGIFGGYFYPSFISNAISFLQNMINLLEKVVMLILGVMAIGQKTINIAPIDKLVD